MELYLMQTFTYQEMKRRRAFSGIPINQRVGSSGPPRLTSNSTGLISLIRDRFYFNLKSTRLSFNFSFFSGGRDFGSTRNILSGST